MPLEDNGVMKKLYYKYRHALPMLAYFIVYMCWFNYLEHRIASRYTIIHMNIDDRIPFCEFFIIPYIIWFGYIAFMVIYLFFTNKKQYYQLGMFLATGMTVFLIISTLFPNLHHLRPYVMPRDNIFSDMVRNLYRIDTSANLWPSIHVYNSLGIYFAAVHNEKIGQNKILKNIFLIISTLIILSTVFLKQHSMFDVMTAFIMSAIVYVVVYRLDAVVTLRNMYHTYKSRKNGRVSYIK